MKVAIITAGQPRFTEDFIAVLNNLKGFETADLYINLWSSNWTDSVDNGKARISKILPSNIVLKKLAIVDHPAKSLPLSEPVLNFDELQWWYDRRIGQIHCLKLAFELITEPYDIIVRVRPDGCTDMVVDLSTINPVSNEIIFCKNTVGGAHQFPNDQFFIGKPEEIQYLCDLYNEFDKYMIKCTPDWINDVHGWALEHIIGTYLRANGKSIRREEFSHYINWYGRSAYTTEKHLHMPIVKDPTE